MAISNGTGSGGDPTRGSGGDKVTEMAGPGTEAPPGALDNESASSGTPDPARGGCLKFGWGCLPLLAGVMLLPAGLYF